MPSSLINIIVNEDVVSIPAKAKEQASQGKALLHVLVSLGYPPSALPYADLLRRQHGLDGSWVIVSPIHWQATHNNAMIVATGQDLKLSEYESRYWCSLFAEYLAGEGAKLHYHDSETWLLSVSDKPLLMSKPVHEMINQPLMQELAALDTTMYWQKFFTESQMFFASHTECSFNGVWMWGGGSLTQNKIMNLCADTYFFPLMHECGAHISQYSPTVRLNQQDVLIVNSINSLSTLHQQQLYRMSAIWYWNNTAYLSSELNWFTRLWSVLTHAY